MRILDLFCGAGGSAWGLQQAFPDAEIIGVDIRPQKNYPFAFVQADALTYPLEGADLVWASPPCQEYSPLRAVTKKRYPDLVAPVRQRLLAWGGPWILENVPQAPLLNGAELCGAVFGLRVYRHRRFEAPFVVLAPPHSRHTVKAGGHKAQRERKAYYLEGGFVTVTGHVGSYCGPAMGITWMTGEELSQAIPPAYSAYLAQFIPGWGRLAR